MLDITHGEWLNCTCCGKHMLDTPEDNADYGKHSFDIGRGLCMGCEEWSWRTYASARLPILREALNDKNKAKLNSLSKDKQLEIVMRGAEKGWFSW